MLIQKCEMQLVDIERSKNIELKTNANAASSLCLVGNQVVVCIIHQRWFTADSNSQCDHFNVPCL